MSITLHTSSNEKILIEDQPFASGGEGAVYRIISSQSYAKGYCVKIYNAQYQTLEKQRKLEFMVNNPPLTYSTPDFTICWPRNLVFSSANTFQGFIMPLAFSNSILLYQICTPTIRKTLPPVWSQKYDRTTPTGVNSRIKLCRNIAAAIHSIHYLKKYVLVDMKPQNVLITDEGKVSIIDLDSIQIANNKNVLFHAQVATPEYIPKEGERLNPGSDYIPDSWDRFSLAVVFYEILFGLHPYTATYSGPYQDSDTLETKIKSGLFVHGSRKQYITSLPPLHQNYDNAEPEIRNLFKRAFEDGHIMPDVRPTAEEWGKSFFLLSQNNPVKSKINLPTTQTINTSPISTTYSTQNTSATSTNLKYANWGLRFGAYLIDSVIWFIIINIFTSIVLAVEDDYEEYIDGIESLGYVFENYPGSMLIFFTIYYFYWVYPITSSWQATLGKKMVGIRITNLNGNAIGFWRVIGRNLSFLLSMVILGIGLLMPLWTSKKQALHDQMADTLVLKN